MPLFSGTSVLLRTFYHFDPSTKVETIEFTVPWKIGGKTLSKGTNNNFIWASGSTNTYGKFCGVLEYFLWTEEQGKGSSKRDEKTS